MDYLSTPSVAAYFNVREGEAYYQALKRVGPRRDFHERLIGILERFIEVTNSPPGAAAVDRVIAESLRMEQSATASDVKTPLEIVRASHPKGAELLRLVEPVTFESLRSAYRSAALRSHPDVGGSHEAMVAVNEAYNFTHLLLCHQEIGRGPAETDDVVSMSAAGVCDCAAYRYKCGEWLFTVELDDWNVDGAFVWLDRITSSAWQQSSYARHPERWMALTAPAGKLAVRLYLAGLHEQASRALAIARRGLQEAQKHDLSYECFVREPEEVLAGKRRAQVVLNHQRQADNALRLGLVEPRRYKKILERLARSVAAEDLYEERFRQFLADGGFLRNLPTDQVAQCKTPKSQLVPEPGYYVTRITQLTDDQQGEYVSAFCAQTRLALVRKYTFVRFTSLLESALFYPVSFDEGAGEREARFIASLLDGNGGFYGAEVAEAIAFLRQQPLSDRQERAELLWEISQHGVTVKEGTLLTLTTGEVSLLGMPLTPEYFKVIRLPVDNLRTIKRTGRIPETEEERCNREAWSRDIDSLGTPKMKAAEQAAFAAIDTVKANPQAAVQQFASYCSLLLDLGQSMVHVQELQLGYWVDRLTATLVRLKQWHEAHEWLQRYFALPKRYHDRSSPSEQGRLQKRLARCAEMLHENSNNR